MSIALIYLPRTRRVTNQGFDLFPCGVLRCIAFFLVAGWCIMYWAIASPTLCHARVPRRRSPAIIDSSRFSVLSDSRQSVWSVSLHGACSAPSSGRLLHQLSLLLLLLLPLVRCAAASRHQPTITLQSREITLIGGFIAPLIRHIFSWPYCRAIGTVLRLSVVCRCL